MRISLGVVLTLVLTASATAQSPSLQADSVIALTDAGHWDAAVRLAQDALRHATTQEDRCALFSASAFALSRAGRLDAAAQQISSFDHQCTDAPPGFRYRTLVDSLRPSLDLPRVPATGLDFSSIYAFWSVADELQRDVEPSEAEWHTLFSTTGYRLSMRLVPSTRRDMEIALRPSRRASFDSVAPLPDTDDDANRIKHIARAVADRAGSMRYRDSIANALPLAQATANAAKFLPPHATDGKNPPLVAFAIFRDDAYSLGDQIVVDLEHVYTEGGLVDLLSHEFHHSYLSSIDRTAFPSNDDPAAPLVRVLRAARNEGIADLVDKPYPLRAATPTMAAYAKRYNAAYARTPQVIHSIDSVLAIAADDPTKLSDAGAQVGALLPSNGHYNGSYLAREILETFGVDSLYPGTMNPFAFWRTYGEAEVKHGRPWPLSPKSQALLDALEKKYIAPRAASSAVYERAPER